MQHDDVDADSEPFSYLEERLAPPPATSWSRSRKAAKRLASLDRSARLLALWRAGKHEQLRCLVKSWWGSGLFAPHEWPETWPPGLSELMRHLHAMPDLPWQGAVASIWWHRDSMASLPPERLAASIELLHARAAFQGRFPEPVWFHDVRAWMVREAGRGAATDRAALARALHAAYPDIDAGRWAAGLKVADPPRRGSEPATPVRMPLDPNDDNDALWQAVAAAGGQRHPRGLALPWLVEQAGWILNGTAWMPCPEMADGSTAETTVTALHARLHAAVHRHLLRFVALVEEEPMPSEAFQTAVQARLRQETWTPVSLEAWEQAKCDGRRAWLKRYRHHRQALVVELADTGQRGLLAQGDYPALFPSARALERELVAVLGPTNSGKTHRAIEALAQAPSGLYLAPLRLLAHEVAERMNALGVPCDLVTGEEVVRVPGAQHVAATIEAGWSNQTVDLAVIDEVQMLDDADRGWAWVQAVVGTCARQVWCLGSLAAEDALRELATRLGEPLSVQTTSRKGPLVVEPNPVGLAQVVEGDTLIAFSRAEVLKWRDILRRRGWKVACIYGALGPEVRRLEAERFRTGQAQVLVATDAIGMGLNLPIRRVIFSTLTKFDGQTERVLTATEIQQIAGRAGRHGLHEEGFVAMLDGGSSSHRAILRQAMHHPGGKVQHHKFSVQPTWSLMKEVLDGIGTKATLDQGLRAFFKLANQGPGWRCGYGMDVLQWAEQLPSTHLPLSDQFAVLGCPVTRTTERQALAWLTQVARGQTVIAGEMINEGWHWASPGSIDTPDDLMAAEVVAHLGTLYRWLALRYPSSLHQLPQVEAMLGRLHPGIAQALAQQHLQRCCISCGTRKMPQETRFRECERCYQARQREHWRGW